MAKMPRSFGYVVSQLLTLVLAVAACDWEYALSTIVMPGYFDATALVKPSRRATLVVAVAEVRPTTTWYEPPAW
jgi:hypothetical protein